MPPKRKAAVEEENSVKKTRAAAPAAAPKPRGDLLKFVRLNDLDKIRELLEDPHMALAREGYTYDHPLHAAAEMGFTVVVELLAKEYDFDVDTQETLQRNTALHIAVRHSQLACAIVLLQLGADTAIVSRDYNATSLSLAMRNHDVRMVEVILTVGLKHGITRPGQDWELKPDLHVAALKNDCAKIEALLSAKKVDVNAPAKGGYTALHIACHFGLAEAVKALLRHGANPTLRNEWGYVPLHFAAMRPESASMEKLIKAPQSHIPSAMNAADKEGHTPLALAIYYKRTAQVRMLLKMGCNTNVRDRSQGTVLHYCAQEGGVCNTIYIDLLIEHGADISILDRSQETPLSAAVAAGEFGAAVRLLGHGADIFMAGTKEMVIIKLIQLAAGRFWEQESAAAAWGILQSQAAIEMSKLEALEDGSAPLVVREKGRVAAMLRERSDDMSCFMGRQMADTVTDVGKAAAALRPAAPPPPPIAEPFAFATLIEASKKPVRRGRPPKGVKHVSAAAVAASAAAAAFPAAAVARAGRLGDAPSSALGPAARGTCVGGSVVGRLRPPPGFVKVTVPPPPKEVPVTMDCFTPVPTRILEDPTSPFGDEKRDFLVTEKHLTDFLSGAAPLPNLVLSDADMAFADSFFDFDVPEDSIAPAFLVQDKPEPELPCSMAVLAPEVEEHADNLLESDAVVGPMIVDGGIEYFLDGPQPEFRTLNKVTAGEARGELRGRLTAPVSEAEAAAAARAAVVEEAAFSYRRMALSWEAMAKAVAAYSAAVKEASGTPKLVEDAIKDAKRRVAALNKVLSETMEPQAAQAHAAAQAVAAAAAAAPPMVVAAPQAA